MRRAPALVGLSGIAAGILVLVSPTPASAAIATTVVGTHLEVVATGAANIRFGCTGGKVVVNTTASTLACTAITYAKVDGDGGAQVVDASGLDDAAFTQHPYISVDLGDGNDTLTDTRQTDAAVMGTGIDHIGMYADGKANLFDMGTGGGTEVDSIAVTGVAGPDTIVLKQTASSASFTVTNSAVTNRVLGASHVEVMTAFGAGGNDTIDASPIGAGGVITNLALYGGDGNDTITGAGISAALFGGAGTNTLTGGPNNDFIHSGSDTDTINGGGGDDGISDEDSLRSGGRTLTSASGTQRWVMYQGDGDGVVRVRPTSSTSATVAASLRRPGLQQLGATVDEIWIYTSDTGTSGITDRPMVDVVALQGKEQRIIGDVADDDLIDITVPAASWGTSGDAGSALTITPVGGGLSPITVTSFGTAFVHGTWANAYLSFAHRVNRDLLFRFPTSDARTLLADQLQAGAKTRAQAVADIMDTDEYRSLDVNRTFAKYLRRPADPSGRVYWINSLADGKPLWRFRAQLIGSNEYFTKAGSTNAKYMVRAYADVMGRAPDPSGQAYWTNKLDHGADRGSVALQFLSSTEARRNVVKDQFLRFLDRYPTTTEADHWVGVLGTSPSGEQDLIAFLAASSAYYTRT